MALIQPQVTCNCPSETRRPPLRVVPDTAYRVRALIADNIKDAVLLTYRCGDCRTIVELRLSDLALVDGGAYSHRELEID